MPESYPDSVQQWTLIPLEAVPSAAFDSLLEEEIVAWRSALCWDYRRTAQLVREYAAGGIIPGVGLLSREVLVGYGYYLLRDGVGSVGAVFVSPTRTDAPTASSRILGAIVSQLLCDPACGRIEGQLFTFSHPWEGLLASEGLPLQRRYYMKRTLEGESPVTPGGLRPWDSDRLPEAARLLFLAYCGHADLELSAAYQSVRNCSQFLRNLVLAPGCGEFLGCGSLVYLDAAGQMGGFVLSSQIASRTALIPQICVRPDLRGRGIGSVLLERACTQLRSAGFQQLHLCVTEGNQAARSLYLRHGFIDVQSFCAFFWNRAGSY